jgi:hypothetical protein
MEYVENPLLLGQGKNLEKFHLYDKVRLTHMHILGATGTGKSKFLEHLIRQDILQGRGLCLIDPHGDLYDDVLAFCVQEQLFDKTLLFDPSDSTYTLGFNPLQSFGDISYKAKQMRSACSKVWQINMNSSPRMARWLYNCFYVLLEQKLSFVDALSLVSIRHNDRRTFITKNIKNPEIRAEFESLALMKPRELLEQLESSYNRIFEFLNNPNVRKLFIQESYLNSKEIMDKGYILLCNLSTRGEKLSEDDRNLLGTLLINEFYTTALTRERLQRNPFYLYIDEFSCFLSEDIASSLSQTRKYGLSMTLAHQDLSQLKTFHETLYKNVLTNCRTKVVFGGLSDEDRTILAKELFAQDFDLKTVKEEIVQTKFKPRLEQVKNKNFSEQKSETLGVGTTETDTVGDSFAKGKAETKSESVTRTRGTTLSLSGGIAETLGAALTHSTGKIVTNSLLHGAGTMKAITQGNSWGTSNGGNTSQGSGSSWNSTHGQSHTNSSSSSHGESHGSSFSDGHNDIRSVEDGGIFPRFMNKKIRDGASHTDTFTRNEQHSFTRGESSSESSSYGQGGNTFSSTGNNWSNQEGNSYTSEEGRSFMDTVGQAEGNSLLEGVSNTASNALNLMSSLGRMSSRSVTKGKSETNSESITVSHSKSIGKTHSQAITNGISEGYSESWITVHDEFQEVTSRTFYSENELLHLAKSFLAKQKRGQMIAKVQDAQAISLTVPIIEEIQTVKLHHIKGFKRFVSKNFAFYVSFTEGIAEQKVVFSDVLPIPEEDTKTQTTRKIDLTEDME